MISSAKILVYSKAAAARILGIAKNEICRFEVWWKVAFVWVKGKRPMFLSLRLFKQHFANWRQEQALNLEVTQVTPEYGEPYFSVFNRKKNSTYRVYLLNNQFHCDCEDFHNQSKFLGKACCKHSYAVLNELGFRTLHDWIDHCQWVPTG